MFSASFEHAVNYEKIPSSTQLQILSNRGTKIIIMMEVLNLRWYNFTRIGTWMEWNPARDGEIAMLPEIIIPLRHSKNCNPVNFFSRSYLWSDLCRFLNHNFSLNETKKRKRHLNELLFSWKFPSRLQVFLITKHKFEFVPLTLLLFVATAAAEKDDDNVGCKSLAFHERTRWWILASRVSAKTGFKCVYISHLMRRRNHNLCHSRMANKNEKWKIGNHFSSCGSDKRNSSSISFFPSLR